MVDEAQDICEPHYKKDASEQVFIVIGNPFQMPNQQDQGMNYVRCLLM